MKRIMVIGVSAGAGKSTFATELGEILRIDVYHLDALYWRPHWIEAPFEEFEEAQREIAERQTWIIEGNYSKTFGVREYRADTIIYLELPRYVCVYRALKRWVMNLGKTRPDMGAGCKEKMEWKFLKYIVTTYKDRRRKMYKRFKLWNASGKEVIVLKSKQEIRSYLQDLKAKQNQLNKQLS
ncbi:topology modulation protein [Thalassobacillus devorans]|uniref:Topology modulation protein n=1 Tax=Thalassobacillus devorans TaxID=279813 RepID=A0ABQ1PLC2_9BACI|nr:topology modulation protein [Thalassobacillus devorans]NIK30167.1 adenylate kinase family enzyme [Thalassobacillus devorans]GGC98850.1 topology modulation protein [Thalassobacillus devorans]